MSQMEMHDPAALLGERMGESSKAALGAAFELVGRRTRAAAEFWERAALTWEPEARLNLQLGYVKQMADDYAGALSDFLSPWAGETAPIETPASAPPGLPAAPVETQVAPEPASFAEVELPKPMKAARKAESSAAADEGHLGGHDGEELDVRA